MHTQTNAYIRAHSQASNHLGTITNTFHTHAHIHADNNYVHVNKYIHIPDHTYRDIQTYANIHAHSQANKLLCKITNTFHTHAHIHADNTYVHVNK